MPGLRLSRVELAIVLMAVCNSVIPLLWMAVRREPIILDDILYALVLWKLLGLYAIVRCSVTTDRQIRSVPVDLGGRGVVVALLAILQALRLVRGGSRARALLRDYASTAAPPDC